MACHVRYSSYWREPWPGACLCNACALRYKKRGLACSGCVYVPFKEDDVTAPCKTCGARFVSYGNTTSYGGLQSP